MKGIPRIANLLQGQRLAILFALLVFLVFLGEFTKPVQDGDLYWHLQSGEWIAQHGALPTADPFSLPPHAALTAPESLRQQFILKQYWLGQLALYGLWLLGGIPALVLFRAFIYMAILGFLLVWMARRQEGYAPFLLVFLVGNLLVEYPNERPQLFSFFFFPVLLFLLETLRQQTPRKLSGPVILLPLLMLLWANIHGAFLLGLVVVAIYLGSEAFLPRRQPRNAALLLAGSLAVVASFLNPNGWNGFLLLLQSSSSAYLASITENLSPWRAALDLKEYYPWYWFFAGSLVVTLLLKRKELEPTPVAVLCFLLILSLSALRHMIYLLLAAPLLVPYLGRWQVEGRAVKITIVALLLLWLGTRERLHLFSFAEHHHFPREAVRFINEKKIAGNFFNLYDWGGYLGFKSGHKNFIDGRGLFETVSAEYNAVLNAEPAWRDILLRHNVRALILPGVQFGGGRIYPLVRLLYFDPSWKLVYSDDVALIFVKDDERNQAVIASCNQDKRHIYEHVLARAAWILREDDPPRKASFLLTIADTALFLGDKERALATYQQVLEHEPENPKAKMILGR